MRWTFSSRALAMAGRSSPSGGNTAVRRCLNRLRAPVSRIGARLGAGDRHIRDDVLYRRSLPNVEEQSLRRRFAVRRNRGHRSDAANRLQREVGRDRREAFFLELRQRIRNVRRGRTACCTCSRTKMTAPFSSSSPRRRIKHALSPPGRLGHNPRHAPRLPDARPPAGYRRPHHLHDGRHVAGPDAGTRTTPLRRESGSAEKRGWIDNPRYQCSVQPARSSSRKRVRAASLA